MKKLTGLLFLIVIALLINSCKKDSSYPAVEATTPVTIKMTDAPANYDAVNIDIVGVEVITSGGHATVLTANTGVFNLLLLANGLDTVIAKGMIPSGTIEQIRIILGENNSVVVDGNIYPLKTPSAQESGLKLQVHDELKPGVEYVTTLDFDASKSIVVQGNGKYLLKPVIRTINTAINGSISGSVALIVGVDLTGTIVTASDGFNSFSTTIDADGHFLLQGIPPGTYAVVIHPPLPLLDVTVTGVVVSIGDVTEIGVINL